MPSWSALEYTKFERERTRPVRDLVAAIPQASAAYVVDAGCGPGNSTEVLRGRYPEAEVLAFDSSADMCAEARRRLPHVRVEQWRVESWVADAEARRADVVLSNAVLQWVPNHQTLLPGLLSRLAAGGTLAIQVPDNLRDPSHLCMEDIARRPPWADLLARVGDARTPIESPEWYVRLLRPLCGRVEVWRTTYHHELRDGVAGIVQWMQGTGLRPFLDPLDADARVSFLEAYQRRLETAYAPLPDGSVLLPFPRLFVVATSS